MAVPLNVSSMEEVPEIMREFVTEDNGVFNHDADRAFAALKAERANSKAARNELAPFKALGKTVEELQALINSATDDEGSFQKLTAAEQQNRSLEKQLKTLQTQFAALQEEAANSKKAAADAKLRKIAGEMIDNLPDEIDKDRARAWLLGSKTANGVEISGAYKNAFALDEDGDLQEVSGISAADWLKETAAALGFKKTSTPGKANPGNADLNNRNADYDAAKQNRNVIDMIRNAPEKK
ncbi:MAG: hypothetical protein J6T08_08930 [Lentisphaeria bacterium]|nr:hypothetical protein [Lentisphaeria bacterium]